MWKGLWVILLAAGCVLAQPNRDLLLPEAVHIVGMVVDGEGKPIADASIDYTEAGRNAWRTNSEGRFELETRAPALVIGKRGFRSELVRTRAQMQPRITLQRINETRTFPTCSGAGQYDRVDDSPGLFQFRRIPEVKAGKWNPDVDSVARSYYLDTRQGRKVITHGSGLWGSETPPDRYVWQSIKYDEVIYGDEPLTIIDARGQFSSGNRWRYVGRFGESAWYSDLDEATARIFDRVLDGACLKPAR